ncbi:MAG: proline iminopeptidase-family hydrolase [Candidatus Velthaea sp.]
MGSMTSTSPAKSEGTLRFRGFDVWYRIVGERDEPGRAPILVLHGGPGATHQYLESLAALASSGRRVIFYDQLGCGRSSHPTDPELYSAELFVDELKAVREALGLERVHLLGQSWGGMLAMQYAIERPAGIASLIVADSPADMRQWVAEANGLRAELPRDVADALTHHEAMGTTDHPAYAAAVEVFYRRHLCRLEIWPDALVRTTKALTEDGFVYNVMNGPSEFHVIGKLKTWSILENLHRITAPTLLLSGKYDEATPAIVEEIHRRIPHSEWILFENSAHTPHLEEPAAFHAAVRGFASGVEANLVRGV